jgi:hypothetical protein
VHRLRSLKGWRDRKELSRQIRFRLLQMQQMNRRQQRTSDLLCKATRAGGKLQLAQPRTATRVRPSVQPPVGHRWARLCWCGLGLGDAAAADPANDNNTYVVQCASFCWAQVGGHAAVVSDTMVLPGSARV